MGDQDLADGLADQGYQLTGRHSAVKLCYWTRESLVKGRDCYKGRFYGIESHRCLQMSPAIDSCNLHCRFCWRSQGWENDKMMPEYDDPELLLERSIGAQRRILSGFKGDPEVNGARWLESQTPRHIAISLTGEPTLYPKMNRFLELCHERGITTFLVTNGTNPDALRVLDPLPTQLYVSVTAPNREVFERLTLPAQDDAWDRLLESLSILRHLRTRRVVRHTLVRGWNLGWVEEYARLDRQAGPDFIEAKGYVYMGRSRQRLGRDHVPEHDEIREFAHRLAGRTGYAVLDESPESKVVLLGGTSEGRFLPGSRPSIESLPVVGGAAPP
ncbi:MAG TPA: 4-demethylwyosine synthase TYW1 [Thermoplasmata archaeon]|nr:4-demethylwyosine synthase TYW1 [Thermoplasmata archaeon]